MSRGAEALRAWREAGGTTSERLSPIEKAKRNPTSLRMAVNGKCWDCVCGEGGDPNPRARIRACPVTACPLHSVRPYQRRAKGEDEDVYGGEDEEQEGGAEAGEGGVEV